MQINLFAEEGEILQMEDSHVIDKAHKALAYVRKRGLPFYSYSNVAKKEIFEKIRISACRELLIGDEIVQNLVGIGLPWSYFPHHWGVKVGKMRTPLDVFNDDALMLKALLSRIKWGGYTNVKSCGFITDAQVRKSIRTASGAQAVSNFRPVTAAGIYKKFGGGVVWDMCSGFGGRLIGAFASDVVTKYIGTDPSTLTFDGLTNIAKDFSDNKMLVELHKTGSECFIPREPIDICFTSPPYFNTEVYSNEANQSCNKFLSPDDWDTGFLRKTIENCFSCLKDNGVMIINIANVKAHKKLEENTVIIANESGFVLDHTLRLRLSSMNKGGFKHEPVFVFRKEHK